MKTHIKTVGDLKQLLAKFPNQLLVKVVTTDGNAMVHEDLQVELQEVYTLSLPTNAGFQYEEIAVPFLEFK